MPALTEGRHSAEFLLTEAVGARARENVTFLMDAAVYRPGTVLKLASGKYSRALAAETAVAICMSDVDARSADARGVILARDAEVKRNQLIYASDVDTSAKITTKITQLAAVGIIVR